MDYLLKKQPFHIPGAEQWTITSRGGRGYRIMLWKPDEPAPAGGFPVIYLLDANACFGAMAEAVRMHARGPHRLEGSVVVGIGYETDQPFDTDARFYDFTIHAAADELPERPIAAPWPETGGAEQFLAFIEDELKPLIEREVPINRARQTLFGHSLGGWFVLYTLFARPWAFQHYAAGSPSIWWKNRYIVPVAEQAVRQWREAGPAADAGFALDSAGEKPAIRLYLGIGSEEKPHMLEDAKAMFERLKAAAIPGFHVSYTCFAEESHLSVLFPFIVRVIRSTLTPCVGGTLSLSPQSP
ncbi:alpha/beta hydrolase [Paenibacillus macerans]|uniref:alpha/beta hydrolase n=1 Tax=Paenibacillus macerans TaxID=44252 RepID=UPI0020420FF6|nr:alpha/beta hydrolase-fold protein [Paenibacillus macerans]MCM3698936.1 alpha/beta hydrolase-fold protein [Paenibacillus macerans]